MKIAQITPYFLPNSGGVEEYVYQISKFLKGKGVDVDVLTTTILRGSKKRLKRVETVDGIRVFRFDPIFSFGDFGQFWPLFIHILLKGNYDAVHVHVYRHPHTLISVLICKLKKIPCIITTHSPFHPSKNLKRKILTLFFDKLFKWYLKLFDKIILINDAEKERFEFIKNKVEVIPIGIPKFFFTKNKSKMKHKNKTILYVGRIHRSKGLEFLLKSAMKVKDKSIKIVLVGPVEDEEYYAKLKKLTLNSRIDVKFLGKVERKKLLKMYDNSHLVVIPSQYEAFGIVILEAFARGKPVIAVKSDGPSFLINHGENGFLIEYGDVKSATKYIRLLLRNKKLYKKISKNNIERAKQFIWEKIAEKITMVYEEVVKSKYSRN